MLALVRGLFKRHTLRAKVSRAIDSGVGFYETTLSHLDGPTDQPITDQLMAWCRETLASTNRPYGVDYVTLTVAIEGPDGSRRAEEMLRVLRPGDFYEGGSARGQVEAALDMWIEAGVANSPPGGRLHAILFSWGDLTSDLLRAS